MFTPDVLLPDQFFRFAKNIGRGHGEKRLAAAILEDAIHCYQTYLLSTKRREQRLYIEAEEWLFSDDSSWTFSFVNICAILGHEVAYIRKGLLLWKQGRFDRTKEQESDET